MQTTPYLFDLPSGELEGVRAIFSFGEAESTGLDETLDWGIEIANARSRETGKSKERML